jgi:guanine deaminase
MAAAVFQIPASHNSNRTICAPGLYLLRQTAVGKFFRSFEHGQDFDLSEIRETRCQLNMNNPFMARAIQLSIENVCSSNGGPFGAVIVKDGKIIAENVNRVTSTNDPTAHAEVLAIRQACTKLGVFELVDCKLYTSCEPCPMCLGAIYWAHISRIYFANSAEDAAAIGFDDSFIYKELKLPHTERKIPTRQMMREEALAAFKSWAEKPDKIEY